MEQDEIEKLDGLVKLVVSLVDAKKCSMAVPTTAGYEMAVKIYEGAKRMAGEYAQLPTVNKILSQIEENVKITRRLARESAYRAGVPLAESLR